jgi:hypothetical protein
VVLPYRATTAVAPGALPGIHVLPGRRDKDVDGRDKPGHDELIGITQNRRVEAP